MRLPNDTQRHAIVGRTGSGKTQAALWALQKRNYDRMPWVVFDYKCDPLIDQIPGLNEIDLRDGPPRRPGLYVVRPRPEVDDIPVDNFMWRMWGREHIGMYLDEGYMISRYNTAYRTLLTQGRSKHIPIITLSQAPAWISPFIFRESEFIQTFHLQTPQDQKRIAEFMPGVDAGSIERFHSYYWDVTDNRLDYLKPVPKLAEILDRFDCKRAPRGWRL